MMIYLDNAATSWPKPPEILQAVCRAVEQAGGNPGRSGHRLSVAAARIQYDCREKIAAFFNAPDPLRVIFSSNATQAINLALRGLLKAGDRVVTASMEHNAVMRPLRFLETRGVIVSIAPCAPDGSLDLQKIAGLIDSRVRLVVINHASNVVGTLLPVAEIVKISHRCGVPVLVDAAQAAGAVPLDMQGSGIDLLAFTGHKELLGPTGTGGLVINPDFDVSSFEPLIFGGTGSSSGSEFQPQDLPDKFESGTANLMGIAGLSAGIDWINQYGQDAIRDHQKRLAAALIEGLSVIPGVCTYGPLDPEKILAIISFTVKNKTVSEVGFRLDEEYGVLTRVGLHCAPAAHRTLGSFPEGTVRLSTGYSNSLEDIQKTLEAVSRVARS
jgi:cysteine desulfurase / selenocysteine lyase